MQIDTQNSVGRALISGTIAGVATAVAASLAGRRETGSYAAPLNATSHVVWGDNAAWRNSASLKYTGTGFLLNHVSAIFWAALYETWFGRRGARADQPRPLLEPVIGAAAVTASAYITDYYLVPDRLTPGFEKRVSGKSLATIYGVLALGLAARDLFTATRERRGAAQHIAQAQRYLH
jgi:vacuolar-type H+-ATPase subunit I/STV1